MKYTRCLSITRRSSELGKAPSPRPYEGKVSGCGAKKGKRNGETEREHCSGPAISTSVAFLPRLIIQAHPGSFQYKRAAFWGASCLVVRARFPGLPRAGICIRARAFANSGARDGAADAGKDQRRAARHAAIKTARAAPPAIANAVIA